jgi:protein TonB
MWSRHASVDFSGISLGVGHFTVPPDASVDEPTRTLDVSESWSSIPTLVVPHGIAAVPRRSPVKARKRTPWHPASDAQGIVERGGSREWFTDRLFVESRQVNLPAACSTSLLVHVALAVLVLAVFAITAARGGLTPLARQRAPLAMPRMMWVVPAVVAPPPPSPALVRPRPTTAPPIETTAAAPLAAPLTVEPEPATRADAASDNGPVEAEVGAAPDGVEGGLVGGAGDAPPVAAALPPQDPAPVRVGDGIARPRKIKDVKPVYPLPAMAAQVGGNVFIEATIGADGKVHNARVVRSIAILDQAALDAVRQWEYEPSRRNGVPVPVTMVIVVTFAIL